MPGYCCGRQISSRATIVRAYPLGRCFRGAVREGFDDGAARSIAKLHVGTYDECRCMQMTVVDACHWHLISSIVDSPSTGGKRG